MILSIFGKKQAAEPENATGRYVRPMAPADIARVVDIIDQHDEDDAEEAQESFADSIEGMFVAVDNGRVVGVTGAIEDPEADGICWLSWTYVDENERRQGLGHYLVDGLLHQLRQSGIRKLFISTGDYVEDGEDIYAPAKGLFQKIGAELELRIEDYFGDGEARYIYGLDLIEIEDEPEIVPQGELIFDDLYEAAECDDAFQLTWREYDPGSDPEDALSVFEGLIEQAKSSKARFLIAAIPSDLAEGATKGLEKKEFQPLGRLQDYYQPGIDQIYWILRFNQ